MSNLSEAGEFSIDLYTMPDALTTKLWEHLVSNPLDETPFFNASNGAGTLTALQRI